MTQPAAIPEEQSSHQVRTVSRFEANLVRLLRFIFRKLPFDQVQPILNAKLTPPDCLSADAIHLVKDALGKGTVMTLLRSGAWRRERFLRSGKPVEGRLWERSELEERTLVFTAGSLDFLMWLTANRLTEPGLEWKPAGNLSAADQYLLFLTYSTIRPDSDLRAAMRRWPAIRENGLCRLIYSDDFFEFPDLGLPDFLLWFSGVGAIILESIQTLCRDRWLEGERNKGSVGDWAQMLLRGRAEGTILNGFLDAAEKAGRRDLTRFLLEAMSNLLASEVEPAFWLGGLSGVGPPRLADRIETQRAGLSLLRISSRLRGWERRARIAGYLDDDFAMWKFWLSEWERFEGDRVMARANRILQQIEPLRPAEPTETG